MSPKSLYLTERKHTPPITYTHTLTHKTKSSNFVHTQAFPPQAARVGESEVVKLMPLRDTRVDINKIEIDTNQWSDMIAGKKG